MQKRDIFYFLGIGAFVACVLCAVTGYDIAAAIAGFIAFMASSLSVKEGKIGIGIYTFIFIAAGYGYIMSPAYIILPLAMVSMSLVPVVRLIFFKSLGYTSIAYLEAGLFLAGLALFINAGMYNHFDWVHWTFPGMCFLLGLILAATFTVGNIDVMKRVGNFLGIRTGSKAPDFNLADQDGNNISLSEYKGKRHVLLVFVRGDWCPTCHIMLRTYERNRTKFAEKNVMLLAIGPDPVGVNKAMMERLHLDYKILFDDKNVAAKAFGMAFQKNNQGTNFAEGIPLPAAFLIDINGIIAYTSNPKKPGEMLMPETIFPVVENLQVA